MHKFQKKSHGSHTTLIPPNPPHHKQTTPPIIDTHMYMFFHTKDAKSTLHHPQSFFLLVGDFKVASSYMVDPILVSMMFPPHPRIGLVPLHT